MFVVEKPLPLEKASELTIRIRHRSQFGDHNIGRFRISATGVPRTDVALDKRTIAADLLKILQTDSASRTPEQVKALTVAYRAEPSSAISRQKTNCKR